MKTDHVPGVPAAPQGGPRSGSRGRGRATRLALLPAQAPPGSPREGAQTGTGSGLPMERSCSFYQIVYIWADV